MSGQVMDRNEKKIAFTVNYGVSLATRPLFFLDYGRQYLKTKKEPKPMALALHTNFLFFDLLFHPQAVALENRL
jgi:hypothetical protein